MKTPCPSPNKEGCAYAERGKCYADTDHIIPRFMSKGAPALLRNYIRTPQNQQQICRFEHDQKTMQDFITPPEIPSDRFMIDAIIQARRARRGK